MNSVHDVGKCNGLRSRRGLILTLAFPRRVRKEAIARVENAIDEGATNVGSREGGFGFTGVERGAPIDVRRARCEAWSPRTPAVGTIAAAGVAAAESI